MVAGMRARSSTSSAAELLAEQARSGLTIAAFARGRGIAPWRLYAARRLTRAEAGTRGCFAEVTVVDRRPQVAGFELSLPGDRRLFIPCGFDEQELARLVAVLDEC